MRTITHKEFHADPAKAWEDAEKHGDTVVLDENGKRRAVLHVHRDPNEQYWVDAIALTEQLRSKITQSDLSSEKKDELEVLILDIWDNLYWASDFNYSLEKDEKPKKEPR